MPPLHAHGLDVDPDGIGDPQFMRHQSVLGGTARPAAANEAPPSLWSGPIAWDVYSMRGLGQHMTEPETIGEGTEGTEPQMTAGSPRAVANAARPAR
jgi:hypothetical protein